MAYREEWRKTKASKLCRWCRTLLKENKTVFCGEECRQKHNEYHRKYMNRTSKEDSKVRRKVRWQKATELQDGRKYKTLKKHIIDNKEIQLLSPLELAEKKRRLIVKYGFNMEMVVKSGLALIKAKWKD